jgi:hypothetical protein
MMGRIKGDPNPPGVENFLFINALNEWGEGNVLEPSVQFGYGYAEAMKEAVRASDEKHIWQSQDLTQGLERIKEFKSSANKSDKPPNVCILIRTSAEHHPGGRFPLDDTILSFQSQNNGNWKAVVFATDSYRPKYVQRRMEPRIKEIILPPELDPTEAADWIIANLTNTDRSCASAKYMLITDAGNQYAPTAFDFGATGLTDFVALNVESRWTIREDKLYEGQLCTRLTDVWSLILLKKKSSLVKPTLIKFFPLAISKAFPSIWARGQ